MARKRGEYGEEGGPVDQHILEEERIAEERSHDSLDLGHTISEQPIRNLPSLRDPIAIGPDATAAQAVAKMVEHRIGCVLVVNDREQLVGVFTERDVLIKIAAQGRSPEDVSVADVMTHDPECLTLDDSMAYALHHMSVGGFRHIPLVDDAGKPTAVIAMRAIVDFMVDSFPREVLNLPPSPQHHISREREGA